MSFDGAALQANAAGVWASVVTGGFNSSADGLWSFSVQAHDLAGNVSVARSLVVTRDTVAHGSIVNTDEHKGYWPSRYAFEHWVVGRNGSGNDLDSDAS